MPLGAGFLRWVLACHTIEKNESLVFNPPLHTQEKSNFMANVGYSTVWVVESLGYSTVWIVVSLGYTVQSGLWYSLGCGSLGCVLAPDTGSKKNLRHTW